jgi:hypothetical protein
MADFSKQYCELYDPEFPWDFDIEVEAETIPKGYYKPMICEGFGFIAIEVGLNGNIYLIFDAGNNEIDKVQYKAFIEKQKLKSDGI